MKRAIPFVIIIIAVVLLFTFTDFGRDFGREGDLPINYMGIGATVHFKDGTSTNVYPSEIVVLPQSVYFEEKEISSVDFKMFGLVHFHGELSKATFNGEITFDAGVDSKGKTQNFLYTWKEGDLGLPQTGRSRGYGTMTVTAQELESWVPQSGEYIGIAQGQGTLDLTFKDGTIDSQSDATSETKFQYSVQKAGVTKALWLWIDPYSQ